MTSLIQSVLHSQFECAHRDLELTMATVTAEQAHWQPPGSANPIGAAYAHVVLDEDAMINGYLRRGPTLSAGEWAGRTGTSAPPPPAGADWGVWARTVEVDLPALHAFARAVFAATEAYVLSLDDAALGRVMDVHTEWGVVNENVAWFLSALVVSHLNIHCGEVAALKGVQGAKGYPF